MTFEIQGLIVQDLLQGLDDLGSERPVTVRSVVARFQIFSAVVSTDTHDYFVLTWVSNLRFMFTHTNVPGFLNRKAVY